MNKDKYYHMFDPEYETMPWRIYKIVDTDGNSVEIAKAYEEQHAIDIIAALNKYCLI